MNGPWNAGGGWTGVVLAGGQSRRMGRDKALIEVEGRTLLDRAMDKLEPLVDELLVVGDPEKHGHLGPFVIGDDTPGQGPLGGLATALRYASHDKVLLLGVDLPGVNARLLQRLKQELGTRTDAVVPRHDGLIEPLVAAYHRRCGPLFTQCLTEGVRKMSDALGLVRTSYLELTPGTDGWPADLFHNFNTPEDLAGL